MKHFGLIGVLLLMLISLLIPAGVTAQKNLNNITSERDRNIPASIAGDYRIFLPVIFREPDGSFLVPNGDFEQGRVIWGEHSFQGWPLIVTAFPPNISAYDGAWAAWLGDNNEEIAYIVQQIIIPPEVPYLAYWYWIDSEDECGNDFAEVLVDAEVVDTYPLCSPYNTGGWIKKAINISAYSGDQVFLTFRAVFNEGILSYLFIDHVSLQRSLIEEAILK